MTDAVSMGPRRALALLASLGVLALAELGAGSIAYRETLDAAVWGRVQTSVDPALPLVVGTGWLDPLARRELPEAARPRTLGAPDLRSWPRFAVLTYGRQRDAFEHLVADGPGSPAPAEVSSQSIGPLRLGIYEHAGAPALVDDLLDPAAHGVPELSMPARDGVRCRRTDDGAVCKHGGLELGRVTSTLAEVGERPRRCLEAVMADGQRVVLTAPDFVFGDELYGHVGFAGMNARLRSDAPVTVTLRRGARTLGTFTFTDDQGWAALRAQTDPGRAPLIVELQSAVRGTWGREGYDAGQPHPVCFELRSFAGEGAA